MIESRLAPRKEIFIKGAYKISEKNELKPDRYRMPGRSSVKFLDVSVSGCAFESSMLLPKGLYLELHFKNFPALGDLMDIAVYGETVYCRYLSKTSHRVGFRFTQIDKNHVNIINAFVTE